MKIRHLKITNGNKTNWKDNLFLNLFFFCKIYVGVFLMIAAAFFGFAGILFLAETLMPDKLHFINYTITAKSFRELCESHHYHEAISLLKIKPEVMEELDSYQLKTELADCYYHVGDYHLAEQIFLDQYKTMGLTKEQMEEFQKASADSQAIIRDISGFNSALQLLKIYEKTGNVTGKHEYYEVLRSIRNKPIFEEMDKLVNSVEKSKTLSFLSDGDFSTRMEVDYRLLKVQYENEPEAAMDSLERHIKRYFLDKHYKTESKLKQINTLISWELDRHHYKRANEHIELAHLMAELLSTESSLEPLGELSDLCFRVHDLDNAELYLSKYGYYIKDYYNKEDLEYILFEMKRVKFLEKKGDWDALENLMERTFGHLRHNIANNLTGMSESQREYYAKELEPNFDEAKRILSIHPSPKMARICLENEVFLRGLLLRSATAVGNSIRQTGDSLLLEKYKKLIADKQELIAREHISGAGNYYKKRQLRNEIADLEMEVSAKSVEYNREKQLTFEVSDIRSNMPKDMAFIEFVDLGNSTAALILKQKGDVEYIPLATNKELAELLGSNPSHIYGGDNLYKMIWQKIEPSLQGAKSVSYQPSGMISRIALDAIKLKEDKFLGDTISIHLVSDVMQINRDNSFSLAKEEKVSLWGGIRYSGDANLDDAAAVTREIMRGNRLHPLVYSLAEVRKTSASLSRHSISYNLYTDSIATERSFKKRSGKGDAILHISTHGFFSESQNNHLDSNPMHNCGIFFAGANRYWTNDSIMVESVNDEDGILRAEEVSNLDFSGCKLVILSACETGLGKADSSEGVYGLQRSFKLAGAENILMSLWAVSDPSTERLMSYFYDSLLSGASPYDSLAKAKEKMRADGAGISEWAGFVLLE